ncbi:MAG: glycoside hydrolase family 65 protein [Chloroflexi bacterium]|nr:glycoside hydrolase family 65 protein [Chloroflexota bacterium]
MTLWHVNEDRFDQNLKKIHSQETVYTIGNGYFCTRGTFEEGYPRANAATLLFGVFDAVSVAKEELANAPDWTLIQLFINGERFRLDRGTILDYHRTLDMQHGILRRSVHWQSSGGVRLHIHSERFASLADEHVGAIRYSVTLEESADGNPAEIVLWSSFNTAEGNYDVMHWETVDQGHEGDLLWLESETKRTAVQLAQTMSFTASQELRKEIVDSDTAPSIRFYGTLASGTTITTEKIVVMYTSRDGVEPLHAALQHHQELGGAAASVQEPDIHNALNIAINSSTSSIGIQTYEQLLAKHKAAWQQFWQQADIIIEGDDIAQIGVRYNIYQLRINASLHDSRYSIAAKGMTGFGYRGHIFHDTEIFMLPFFTYVLPEIARNLLLYRYQLLDAARKKAASNGYEGAQYPWESTLNGEETTPPSIIHPETGEVIPVLNGFIELHITSSIAHALWEYWQVTGDDDFMRDYGAEIMLSTAQFWGSRAEKHVERDDYEITNVIGPDEWHEHVNNNAYTNYMAKWNIQKALDTLTWLEIHTPNKARDLVQQLNLTDQRLNHWHDVADHMYVPQDKLTGLFEQFDGFFQLEPLDQEQYKGRKDSYQGILGVHDVQKYRIVKQADVLMLLTVLAEEFDLKTKEVNWDYYYPITDHDYGSSLTPALHVILACELGRVQEAYELFLKGALVDLENLRGNTPEGIHTACSGAVWQATVLGVAGLRVTENGVTTHPCWPDGWTRLAFTIKHKGEPISIDLHR